MKKHLLLFITMICFASSQNLQAQRYLTEIFDSCDITTDVNFGVNVNPLISTFPAGDDTLELATWQAEMDTLNDLIAASAINPDTLLDPIYIKWFAPNGFIPGLDSTMVKITPLTMDVYTPPAEDEVTERPVFIYIHTGNFLPPVASGQITGDKTDSAAVNICKQMAKRGYVAASINYRLGWNPISTDENTRRGTLLQAVYRALHDTQTAVRFLKLMSATYGIDSEKINLIGQGSGGYVAQAYATLDDYISEIATLPKFINTETLLPYVIEAIDGDINGGPGLVRLDDPMHQLGLSKDICMAVNMGGSLADSTWLDAGEPAMVAFHCIRDPYAPFDRGMVVVPTTNEDVVEVDGGNVFIRIANELGNNDAFADIPDGDPYTDAARSHYGETYDYIYATQPTMTVSETPEGLYPFLIDFNDDISVFGNVGAPWDWTTLEAIEDYCLTSPIQPCDAQTLYNNLIFSNPDMSEETALTYIDTIQGYLHPRVVLQCDLTTGIAEQQEVQDAMLVFPNPANSSNAVTIRNDKARMSQIIVLDGIGRQVFTTNVNDYQYMLQHDGWPEGMYFVTVLFEEGGQLTRKLILR